MKKWIIVPIFMGITLTALTFQNCGTAKESASLTVRFPSQLPSNKLSVNTSPSGTSQAPTPGFDIFDGEVSAQSGSVTADDYNCFGVMVGGGSLGTANRCEDSLGAPTSFAKSIMGVSGASGTATGSFDELEVGDSVTVHAIAWRAQDAAACASLQSGTAVQGSKLSRPILIGSQNLTLSAGANEATISGLLSTVTEFIGCNIFTAENTEPLPVIIGGTVNGPLQFEQVVNVLLLDEFESAIEGIGISNPGEYFFNVLPAVGTDFFISITSGNNACQFAGRNSGGTFNDERIDDIDINCLTQVLVNVTGLSQTGGAIDLRLNVDQGDAGSQTIQFISQDGPQVFNPSFGPGSIFPINAGQIFDVTPQNTNAGEVPVTCTVTNGTNRVFTGSDVLDVQVNCVPIQEPV